MRKIGQGGMRSSGTSLVFGGWLVASLGGYVVWIILLILADICFVFAEFESLGEVLKLLSSSVFRDAITLTFVSCTMTAILSLFLAVPVAYLLSRFRFWGKSLIEGVLDIPVILPPLVMGLSLLLLFNQFPPVTGWGSLESWLNGIGIQVTNTKLAVVIAQFTVAGAFAIRVMKATFDQIPPRIEEVAMTLGASRGRAFFDVVLPQTYKGVLATGTLSWARALGEFGPILVFAGATRAKTEVLSTSVYLEMNTGNIGGAVVLSLCMIILAMVSILTVRLLCERKGERA